MSELFIPSFHGFEVHIKPLNLVSCCKPYFPKEGVHGQ